jgi:hypothetical protein
MKTEGQNLTRANLDTVKIDWVHYPVAMVKKVNIEEVRERLSKEIVGCFNCQPWDEGEPVWLGPYCYVTDLLEEQNVPEELVPDVLERLQCPRCGTNLDDPGAQVEVMSQYDKKVEYLLEKIQSPELIEKLSTFSEFLEKYPYLGLKDPRGIGHQIMKAIKGWPASKLEPRPWYRARMINDESRVFRSSEMCAPDPEKVFIREGRYNHTGQSFLYLSDSRETAFLEIRQANENVCAMQKFRGTETINVVNLRHDYFGEIDPDADFLAVALIYNHSLVHRPKHTSSWKPEYFVPRFVADCARLKGYDGIWFSSTARSLGENLVVFPEKISAFKLVGECKPFLFKEEKEERRKKDSRAFINLLDYENDD